MSRYVVSNRAREGVRTRPKKIWQSSPPARVAMTEWRHRRGASDAVRQRLGLCPTAETVVMSMKRQDLTQAILGLGHEWSVVGDKEFDGSGVMRLSHAGGLSVLAVFVPVPTQLCAFYAHVGELPDEAALRRAFEFMNFYLGVESPSLGLIPGTNVLTITQPMSLTDANLDALAEALDVYVETIESLRAELGIAADTPGEIETEDADETMLTAMRV